MEINIASIPAHVFQSFQSGFPDNGTIVPRCPSAVACTAIDNFPAKNISTQFSPGKFALAGGEGDDSSFQ